MLVKFSEVRCDYFEDDTNLYYIDAWVSDDDDAEGMSVATVDEDGVVEWRKGNSIMYLNNRDIYANLFEAIEEAKHKQRERKQELVDKCLEAIKEDVRCGDITAIDELLMFLPTKYLKGYLPEE